MCILLDCVSCGESAKPAPSLLIDLEQLSSVLDSGTTSSKPDFSNVVVNTKESTDESGQVAAYPLYENFAEVDNLATDGRPEKKRIDAIDGPISLQVRETIPEVPTKFVFQVEASEAADQTAMQAQANNTDRQSHTRLTWGDGLEQLKAFKVKFGHVDVPTFYTDQQNQPLRNFVKNIRKSYKNIQEGQTSGNEHLSDQRISELERMGFKLQARTSWEHRFEELRQHFRTHGNLDGPMNSVLKRWVYHQRSDFRMMLKGARNSLTEKRIGLLNSIGFDWRVVMKVQVPDQVSVNADQGRLCLMISFQSRSKSPINPFISCSCSMRLLWEQCRTCRFIAKCSRTFKCP